MGDNFSHCYSNTSSYFLTIIKMIVGSINEDRKIESRVAITPDNVKKFIGLGLKVLIEKNYAGHLGIDDNEYVSSGAEISEDKKKILNNSNFILQFNLPSEENLNSLKENQNLIGVFNPYTNKAIISDLSKKKNQCIFVRIATKNY